MDIVLLREQHRLCAPVAFVEYIIVLETYGVSKKGVTAVALDLKRRAYDTSMPISLSRLKTNGLISRPRADSGHADAEPCYARR